MAMVVRRIGLLFTSRLSSRLRPLLSSRLRLDILPILRLILLILHLRLRSRSGGGSRSGSWWSIQLNFNRLFNRIFNRVFSLTEHPVLC